MVRLMTARTIALNLGRDSAHWEYSYPSQAAASEALGARLRRARVERWLVQVFGPSSECARTRVREGA